MMYDDLKIKPIISYGKYRSGMSSFAIKKLFYEMNKFEMNTGNNYVGLSGDIQRSINQTWQLRKNIIDLVTKNKSFNNKKSLKKIANEDCKEHWSCSECPQYLDQEIEINNFKYTCISLMVLDLVDP